jgi:2-dehydro-3-deoxyphosphogluconate aldolase/(4S)-4-hydroxy-2-oxoglutarate aldolase
MLQSLAGPYAHTGVQFVPLGGVNANNMSDYLALPSVAAIGGSWICDRALVREQRWSEITQLSLEAAERIPSIS